MQNLQINNSKVKQCIKHTSIKKDYYSHVNIFKVSIPINIIQHLKKKEKPIIISIGADTALDTIQYPSCSNSEQNKYYFLK